MKNCIVYGIQNLTNAKMYIGMTRGTVEYRWRCHCNAAISQKEESKFYRAIRKYGAAAFAVDILVSDLSEDEAYAQEEQLIRILGTKTDGYNTAYGGKAGMRKEWTVAGITYESKMAAARAHGVYYPKMQKRLALGHTPEQAVGLEDMPTWKVGVIRVDGIEYASRSEAARAFNMDAKLVAVRINKLGWTLEQALGIEPHLKRVAPNAGTVTVDGSPMSYAAACMSIGYNTGAISVLMQRNPSVSPQEAFEILRERAKAR